MNRSGSHFRIVCGIVAALAVHATTSAIAGGEPRISIAGDRVRERTGEPVRAVFTVALSSASRTAITVSYETLDGSAEAPQDYVATGGTLRFEPGDTNRSISIRVKGDRIDEPAETLSVRLFNARGATISRGRAIATIIDDDPTSRFRGTWNGTTSQGEGISFTVNGDGKVISLEVTYLIEGFRCSRTSTIAFGTPARIKDRAFTARYSDEADAVVVKGTFSSASAVTGTISATQESPCDGSTNPTWSASKA